VDDYEALFAWGPDAVIVCTENSRHIDAVGLAAAERVHVLCEKPLATTVADAEEMVRLTAEAGVFLMTAFPVRFIPAFEALRARVAAGDLGQLMAVLGTNNGKIPIGDRAWFTDPQFAGGGALVDHVVHCADLLDALLGELPVTVRAVSNSILHAQQGVSVETAGLVTLEYPGGVIATIDCSWSQPENAAVWGNVGLEVLGSRGSVTFEGISRSVQGTDRDGGVWIPFGFNMDAAMIDYFLRCVRDGMPPQPDGQTGVGAARIVEAALESTRTGQPVALART
jgi:predicted dehydrogenase